MSDGLSEVLWFRDCPKLCSILYEDNEAVIKLMKDERKTHQRTKHLDARYFHAGECEQKGEIIITLLPTAQMIADLMTKPLQEDLFNTLTAKLTGNY